MGYIKIKTYVHPDIIKGVQRQVAKQKTVLAVYVTDEGFAFIKKNSYILVRRR